MSRFFWIISSRKKEDVGAGSAWVWASKTAADYSFDWIDSGTLTLR